MRKMHLAAFAVTAVMAATLVALPADAQQRTRKDDGGYRYDRSYRNDGSQYNSGGARPRPDPRSLDGHRTGQPRTCGHDFFIYDDQGVPSGPYCN